MIDKPKIKLSKLNFFWGAIVLFLSPLIQAKEHVDDCGKSGLFTQISSEFKLGSALSEILHYLNSSSTEYYTVDKKTMDMLLDRHRDTYNSKVVVVPQSKDRGSSSFYSTQLISLGFDTKGALIGVDCNSVHTGP